MLSSPFPFLNAQARPQLYMRSNLGTTFFIVSQWTYVKCTLKCILKHKPLCMGRNLGGHSWERVEIMDLWQHCLLSWAESSLVVSVMLSIFYSFFSFLICCLVTTMILLCDEARSERKEDILCIGHDSMSYSCVISESPSMSLLQFTRIAIKLFFNHEIYWYKFKLEISQGLKSFFVTIKVTNYKINLEGDKIIKLVETWKITNFRQ